MINNLLGAGAQSALTGRSLEQEMYDLRSQQYANALGQSMLATKNAAAQNIYNTVAHQQAVKPFNPNDQEAYKIPLSQLVTLWQAKFGDEWVQKFEDEFWHDAMFRLKAAGKLEEAKHTWFRIKEDA